MAVPATDTPILWWWSFLFLVSAGNLALWLVIARGVHGLPGSYVNQQLWLSGIFAAACAFRSVLPRVDLERQCLWNSPLVVDLRGPERRDGGGALLRRTVRVAISKLSALTGNVSLQVVAWTIVPLILVAQVCCWYAVISLNHLGHAIEEILWSGMVFLVALSLGLAWGQMPTHLRLLSLVGILACAGAALVMLAVDVPMYLARWRHGRRSGLRYLPLMVGVKDALQRRRVSRRWSEWRPEILWMSLYFSAGVWLSFCLVFV